MGVHRHFGGGPLQGNSLPVVVRQNGDFRIGMAACEAFTRVFDDKRVPNGRIMADDEFAGGDFRRVLRDVDGRGGLRFEIIQRGDRRELDGCDRDAAATIRGVDAQTRAIRLLGDHDAFRLPFVVIVGLDADGVLRTETAPVEDFDARGAMAFEGDVQIHLAEIALRPVGERGAFNPRIRLVRIADDH